MFHDIIVGRMHPLAMPLANDVDHEKILAWFSLSLTMHLKALFLQLKYMHTFMCEIICNACN